MNCDDCPFRREHDRNFKKMMKEFDDTIAETKELLGEGAYDPSGKEL